MRLWTIHPRYLDAQGLTAAWREALLAQKVLAGATRGYRYHPQLIRFRSHPEPIQAVGAFLAGLAEEAGRRSYAFDVTKILEPGGVKQIEETEGQLLYELAHLREKLHRRAPDLHRQLRGIIIPEPHPLFRIIPGGIREWEKR
ncbi:MAG TPA: pyrimidine dimer DNA glycosylase/endonuclease V [Nitrosospira sp.]